jgi:hypothetical protein
MILPRALMLGAQLMIPIAAGDGVPNLNVEPVCKGIAEQGGVTFRDPASWPCANSSSRNGRAFQPPTDNPPICNRFHGAGRCTQVATVNITKMPLIDCARFPHQGRPSRMWPISTRVNKPENDDTSIVEPIDLASSAA